MAKQLSLLSSKKKSPESGVSLVNPVSTNCICREGRDASCNESPGNKTNYSSKIHKEGTSDLTNLRLAASPVVSQPFVLRVKWNWNTDLKLTRHSKYYRGSDSATKTLQQSETGSEAPPCGCLPLFLNHLYLGVHMHVMRAGLRRPGWVATCETSSSCMGGYDVKSYILLLHQLQLNKTFNKLSFDVNLRIK